MRYSLYINQVKVMEWGLNLAQASVFSVLNEAHSWASSTIFDGEVYYWFSKTKLIKELPVVTDKPDTIKRHLAALEKLGLIRRKTVVEGNNTYNYIAITEKGKQWNAAPDASDTGSPDDGKNIPPRETSENDDGKNLSEAGNISPNLGINIPNPREIYPANTNTSNPLTNDPKDHLSDSVESNETAPVVPVEKFDAKAKREFLAGTFDLFWNVYQRKDNRKAAEAKWLKIPLPNDQAQAVEKLQFIIDQADRWGNLYAAAPADQKQFQPMPTTWINNERWNDEQLPTIRQPPATVNAVDWGDINDPEAF